MFEWSIRGVEVLKERKGVHFTLMDPPPIGTAFPFLPLA